MGQPDFSVVIPSYNHAAFIGEAVESVLSQSHASLELIVVDDGSRDESLKVLRGLSDPRLHVLPQANQGAHAAINRGLEQATGKYLAILNSDDAYHPERLEKAWHALEAQPQIGLLGSYIQIVDGQGRTLGIKHGYRDCPPWELEAPEKSFRGGDDLHAALLTENYLATTSNFIFPRRFFQEAGGFRPLRYAHDWDFALRMAQKAPLELIPDALVRYRVHASNTIRENKAAMIFEICWILAVHLPPSLEMEWFAGEPTSRRVEQFLHSIYTFGMERVLAAMLVQDLTHHPERAEQLLCPSDLTRLSYLDYIQTELTRANRPAQAPILAGWKRLARRVLKPGK